MADKKDGEGFDQSSWSFDLQQLGRHMKGDTEVDVIIRGHLYIEHVLIEFLREALPKPHLLKVERLSFPSKAELCVALNLVPEETLPTIKYVNAMRNKVAHNLHVEIGNQEKLDFFKLFPSLGQKLIREDNKPGQCKEPETVNLGHYFIVLAVLIDISRQRYVDYQKQRKAAFENARQLLDQIAKG